jgi:hypothetical protein
MSKSTSKGDTVTAIVTSVLDSIIASPDTRDRLASNIAAGITERRLEIAQALCRVRLYECGEFIPSNPEPDELDYLQADAVIAILR